MKTSAANKEMHRKKSTFFFFSLWILTQDCRWGGTAPGLCLPVYPWRGEETTGEKRKEAHVKTTNIITWYRHSAGVRLTSASLCFSLLGGCNLYGLPQTISKAKNKSDIQYSTAGVKSLERDVDLTGRIICWAFSPVCFYTVWKLVICEIENNLFQIFNLSQKFQLKKGIN